MKRTNYMLFCLCDAAIKSVTMLGSDEAVEWEQQEDVLVLKFPESRPC